MKALLLKAPREVEAADLPEPEPPAGWSLVRTELAGICGTDKAFYRGTYPLFKKPLVPGHEVVGVVEEGPLNYVADSASRFIGSTLYIELNSVF